MKKNLFDIKQLITMRQIIHKFPELSKKEFQTQKRIKDFIISKGVDHQNITSCAETGLIIDISGKKITLNPEKKIIALRADIDGLETKEENHDLTYRSQTDGAHLCGHDGHITTLLGGLCLTLENIKKIPSNITIRFLFQPAEEKYGGAKRMVEEGALEGVSEVWGLHNIPREPKDKIFCIDGPMVSGGVGISILVKGQGGHSSLKKILIDPVFPLAEIIVKMEAYLEGLGDVNNEKIIASFPKFIGSQAGNIIPNKAEITGVCRFFDEQLKLDYLNKLDKVVKDIEIKRNVTIEIKSFEYPLLVNDKKLVDDLKSICEVSDEGLPIKFSEDFSEFSKVVPGCFYLYSIGNPKKITLHDPNYNFNDDCLENMARLWWKIIENRCLK